MKFTHKMVKEIMRRTGLNLSYHSHESNSEYVVTIYVTDIDEPNRSLTIVYDIMSGNPLINNTDVFVAEYMFTPYLNKYLVIKSEVMNEEVGQLVHGAQVHESLICRPTIVYNQNKTVHAKNIDEEGNKITYSFIENRMLRGSLI